MYSMSQPAPIKKDSLEYQFKLWTNVRKCLDQIIPMIKQDNYNDCINFSNPVDYNEDLFDMDIVFQKSLIIICRYTNIYIDTNSVEYKFNSPKGRQLYKNIIPREINISLSSIHDAKIILSELKKQYKDIKFKFSNVNHSINITLPDLTKLVYYSLDKLQTNGPKELLARLAHHEPGIVNNISSFLSTTDQNTNKDSFLLKRVQNSTMYKNRVLSQPVKQTSTSTSKELKPSKKRFINPNGPAISTRSHKSKKENMSDID